MIGLLKPDSGQVLVDGENIVSMGRGELNRVREKFGVLFQNAALFDSMTIFENVAFPLEEKTRLSREEIRNRVHRPWSRWAFGVSMTSIPTSFPEG